MTERAIQSVPAMPVALMLACVAAVIGVFYAVFLGALFSLILTAA